MVRQGIGASVILIGCGNMGFALLKGWVETMAIDPGSVHVVEPQPSLRERAASLGVCVHETKVTLPNEAALIIIAIKPQLIPDLLPAYRAFARSSVFVSIAAGVEIVSLSTLLGEARVIRAMPNTPTAIGKGSTVLFAGPGVEESQLNLAINLFKAGGAVHTVEEEVHIDAATAISGSGPAYIFYLMECLASAAIDLGLPKALAEDLAIETVNGAGALALNADVDPRELRRQVTSPKGTTEAGLKVLMADDQMRLLLKRTAASAFQRSTELSRG